MIRFLTTTALIVALAGCGDGQPFFDDEETVDPTDPGEPEPEPGPVNDVLQTGTVLPPGAPTPEPDLSITRMEARNGEGGGLLASVEYVPGNDTFIVDGLGFDGANVYTRGTVVGQIGTDDPDRPRYAVYNADLQAVDELTGDPIGQIAPYRAIYAVSDNTDANGDPRTAFAIVRTGGYAGYGFGGFLYERNGEVTLPTTGQAIFTGGYAGMRVFENSGGLEFTRADMEVAVDFRDFNANDAVRGRIFNREATDAAGTPIPLDTDPTDDINQLELPDLRFVIQEGAPVLTSDGEIGGNLNSVRRAETGALEIYEEGTYYGILAGNMTAGDGGELVGIIVVESEDPRFTGVNAQETGGFILYRGGNN